jgi:hypothetical protein
MKTYCIINVSDYHGGDLHSYTNLTFSDFIDHVTEIIDNNMDNIDVVMESRDSKINSVLGDKNYVDTIKMNVQAIISNSTFYGNYAGSVSNGDACFYGEFYEVKDSTMTEIKLDSFVDDIVECIKKNWQA